MADKFLEKMTAIYQDYDNFKLGGPYYKTLPYYS